MAAIESSLARQRRWLPVWFLMPSLLVLALFTIYPTIEVIITSVSRYNLTDPAAGRVFTGLENYRQMLADPRFWGSLGRSLQFVVVSVGASMLLGFYVAYLLSKVRRGKELFRVIFLVPMSISPAITALTFKFMLNQEFGVINRMLAAAGVGRLNFLGDPNWALWTTVGIDVWISTPLVILILLAGLEALPDEPYEAAALDGAGTWQMLGYITLPLMKRFILVAMLLRIMDAFRVYETIQLTTAGGPGSLSETLNIYIAKRGFSFFEMGPASAMALFLTVLVVAISVAFVRLLAAFEGAAA